MEVNNYTIAIYKSNIVMSPYELMVFQKQNKWYVSWFTS